MVFDRRVRFSSRLYDYFRSNYRLVSFVSVLNVLTFYYISCFGSKLKING